MARSTLARVALIYPEAAPEDVDAVRAVIGRVPRTAFEVVVRSLSGAPVVIRNAPLERDGTPMPTRFWLVGPVQIAAIGHIEAAGGVRRAESEVAADEVAAAHVRYGAERDACLPPDWDGPVPSGGVGGTRQGVKCLHAHYAWYLAGGDDPIGRWTQSQLDPAGTLGLRSSASLRCSPGLTTPYGRDPAGTP